MDKSTLRAGLNQINQFASFLMAPTILDTFQMVRFKDRELSLIYKNHFPMKETGKMGYHMEKEKKRLELINMTDTSDNFTWEKNMGLANFIMGMAAGMKENLIWEILKEMEDTTIKIIFGMDNGKMGIWKAAESK